MNLKKTKNSDNTKQLIVYTIILFVIALFAFAYFIFLPKTKKIKELRVNIANTKISINKNIEEDKNLSTQQSKLKEIENRLTMLDKVFVERTKELEFITTLESVASKNNVSQDIDLNSLSKESNAYFESLPLSISVKGKFSDITKYLLELNAINYYLNITELSLSKSIGASSFSFNTDGSSYYSGTMVNLNIKANIFLIKNESE